MMMFAGLDVGGKRTAVCVIDAAGKIVWRGMVDTRPEMIDSALKRFAGKFSKVGLESGPFTPHLFRSLAAMGYPMVCMGARRAADAIKSRRIKCNLGDAWALADRHPNPPPDGLATEPMFVAGENLDRPLGMCRGFLCNNVFEVFLNAATFGRSGFRVFGAWPLDRHPASLQRFPAALNGDLLLSQFAHEKGRHLRTRPQADIVRRLLRSKAQFFEKLRLQHRRRRAAAPAQVAQRFHALELKTYRSRNASTLNCPAIVAIIPLQRFRTTKPNRFVSLGESPRQTCNGRFDGRLWQGSLRLGREARRSDGQSIHQPARDSDNPTRPCPTR
jgi:hypothetical protein